MYITDFTKVLLVLNKLDETDKAVFRENIARLYHHWLTSDAVLVVPTGASRSDLLPLGQSQQTEFVLDVTLSPNRTFRLDFLGSRQDDAGFRYLSDYIYYRELINLHNLLNPSSQIAALFESFTLISGYRNYHAFTTGVSLRNGHPAQQIEALRSEEFERSLNAAERAEPSVFAIVRLRVAEKHFSLIREKMSDSERDQAANDLPLLRSRPSTSIGNPNLTNSEKNICSF